MSRPDSFRAGYVAIVGEPNVGKSTLMNAMLHQKISIVTPKPQTTRHKVLGVLSDQSHQIVFLDTPGLLVPKYRLHKAMMVSAHSAIDDADIILLMIDATNPKTSRPAQDNLGLTAIQSITKPVSLLINKLDRIDKSNVLTMMDWYSKQYPFVEIFPISALKGDNIPELIQALGKALPVHAPYYPTDIVSDQNERFFVAEIIREKIFQYYQEEVPYSTSVDIVDFREEEGKKDHISAEIYVERGSQKSIIIGKGGRALKEVGRQARRDIEEFLGRPVFLELYVKARPDWRDDEKWLKRLGYKSE